MHVPVKGEGVRSHFYQLHHSPEVFTLLLQMVQAWQNGQMACDLTPQQVDLLLKMGILTTDPKQLPQDVAFNCVIGSEAMAGNVPTAQNWELNPDCLWQHTAEIPLPIGDVFPASIEFRPHIPLLWVRDPHTLVWMPFWFLPETLAFVEPLLLGQITPVDLPTGLRHNLALAAILQPLGHEPIRRWADTLPVYQDTFKNQHHALVRGLINPVQLQALQLYARTLSDEGYFTQGDGQVALRKWVYKDPVMTYLQHLFAESFSQIVGEPVQPTYPYLTIYQPGAVLERHTDRQACRWNVSLMLDDTDDDSRTWPLYLEVGDEVIVADLVPGDALIYRGTAEHHWRDPMPAGRHVTVCILHYVPQDFDGVLG